MDIGYLIASFALILSVIAIEISASVASANKRREDALKTLADELIKENYELKVKLGIIK